MTTDNPDQPTPDLTQPADLSPGAMQPSGKSADDHFGDTQPTRVRPGPPVKPAPRWRKYLWVGWLFVFLAFTLTSSLIGAFNGYQAAQEALRFQSSAQTDQALKEQYELALQDLEAGRYELARQRFEYILDQDANYPGVTEKLSLALSVLYATATPTPPHPTATPTSPPPTRDLRPLEEQLQSAANLAASQDWSKAIESLQALRQSDPGYQTVQVDRFLWVALRSRGIRKIYQEANLEGGIYDLALAERFGVIDVEADVARNMARLYLYGLAFWEVYPEKAVDYFGQVAAAMPNLRDSSGWTARERYYASLLQYGDQLYNQKRWCDAKAQYELAWAISQSQELAEKLRLATEQCLGYTETPTATGTATLTAPAGGETATATSTQPMSVNTPTSTATSPILPAATHTPTLAVTDTQPPAPAPSDTATAQDTQPPPAPSDTPAPSATNTEQLPGPNPASTDTQSAQPLVVLDPSSRLRRNLIEILTLLPLITLPFLMAVFQPVPGTPEPEKASHKKATSSQKNGKQLKKPGCSTRSILLTLLLIVSSVFSGWGAFALTRQVVLRWKGNIFSQGFTYMEGSATPASEIPGLALTGVPEATPTIIEIAPSLKPWDGAGRVTALIMGLDFRDWSAQEEASRSDTMILLTLDPQSKTAGMISIPRDMWVNIPGFKHGKINTAYYLGDLYKLPGGGPALAVKTVEQFLGVEINYFAQIDFSAFVRFIDEIGGVMIDVPAEITIDLLGKGFKTKKTLQPGRQVLPGEWALAYARARHTEGGDFDRAARQQQVIMAIRERMLDPKMMPKIIEKAPTLFNEIAAGIRTNLSLDQVIQLALLAQTIPEENIQRGIIGKESVFFGTSPDGLAILIPVPDKIHLVRDHVFASSSSLGPLTAGTDIERLLAEQAHIALYDGSNVSDLLNRTGNYLRSLGIALAQSGIAGQNYTVTTIIDHTGNPYTVKYLVDLFNIHATKIYFKYDPSSTADVEIYLGLDWARKNTLP